MKLRLKQIRKAARLTQQQLADSIGVSKSYVSEIESGKKQINGKLLDAFSKALNCSPCELIDDPDLSHEIAEHIAILKSLSEADRLAVLRHASSLVARPGSESD
jgi:transcriptional regulator with XRE-family HTH domain